MPQDTNPTEQRLLDLLTTALPSAAAHVTPPTAGSPLHRN